MDIYSRMFEYLNTFSCLKLRKLCKEENIGGYRSLRKNELLKYIKKIKYTRKIEESVQKLVAL